MVVFTIFVDHCYISWNAIKWRATYIERMKKRETTKNVACLLFIFIKFVSFPKPLENCSRFNSMFNENDIVNFEKY